MSTILFFSSHFMTLIPYCNSNEGKDNPFQGNSFTANEQKQKLYLKQKRGKCRKSQYQNITKAWPQGSFAPESSSVLKLNVKVLRSCNMWLWTLKLPSRYLVPYSKVKRFLIVFKNIFRTKNYCNFSFFFNKI